MDAGSKLGDGREVVAPEVVDRGKFRRARSLFEDVLPSRGKLLALPFDHRFVFREEAAYLQVLTFDSALYAFGIVFEPLIADSVPDQKIVFQRDEESRPPGVALPPGA